jgi:hypothetical protein
MKVSSSVPKVTQQLLTSSSSFSCYFYLPLYLFLFIGGKNILTRDCQIVEVFNDDCLLKKRSGTGKFVFKTENYNLVSSFIQGGDGWYLKALCVLWIRGVCIIEN